MSKTFTSSDFAVYELNNIQLRRRASILASQNNMPVLVLARELYSLKYCVNPKVRYVLYLKSPYDEHFTKIKQFDSTSAFCLWYVTKHPFVGLDLITFSEI